MTTEKPVMSIGNNRRIAKNTLALYCRMGLMMLAALYTSRVVLHQLGVDDYGIYNIVGGVVVVFSFLNTAMSVSTQRFLNFELGREDRQRPGEIFSMSLSIHFGVAAVVLILAESIGLWYVNSKLNMPAARLPAANRVYQLSIAVTLLSIVRAPYNAAVIAYERMSFYAWTGIINAALLLAAVFLLKIISADKLIIYAVLVLLVNLAMLALLVIYCRCSFPETVRYHFRRDKELFSRMVFFSGWNLFGGAANVGNSQGINIVMNYFCGVAVNAALGIANVVSSAVYQFVANFQTAFNPQIVKLFSAGEHKEFLKLIFRASRFSFYLLFFLTLPLLLNTGFVLKLWLATVPKYTGAFVQWTLGFMLIETISGPLWMSIQATEKIRNYQIIVSMFILSSLPAAIILLWLGASPVYVLAARTGVNLATMIWRIFYLRDKIRLPSWRFLKLVCGNVLAVGLAAAVLPLALTFCVPPGWTRLLSTGTASVVCVSAAVWFLGLNRRERGMFIKIASEKFQSLRRREACG